ncbi:MAG: DUF1549 and DUF1553 domain-containing protein [Planctomycetaceae bacterium]
MNRLSPLVIITAFAVLGLTASAMPDDEPVDAKIPNDDPAVAKIPVISPPTVAAATVSQQIDALFEQRWRQDGFHPMPLSDDAAFMRRLSLDLTGIIPEANEARDFLSETDPEKRVRLIDHLLSDPRHAAHLANVWRDVLLPRTVPDPVSLTFERWLKERFQAGVPYDQFVRDILLARGSLEQAPQGLFFTAVEAKPSELASNSSRAFLGMQIRCAECHDHPFDTWKQDDFWGLAAFFARVQAPADVFRPGAIADVMIGEVQNPTTKQTIAPIFPGGGAVELQTSEPRRAILARWMTSDENPWFARAAVNRVWWIMFGRGLVHPVDNMGPHNPPTHPEVLELLTADFIANNHDVKRLVRIIAGSRVYQLASATDGNDDAFSNYTAMIVRSLSSKQIYDCMIRATGRRDPLDSTAVAFANQRREFLAQIDVPIREAAEFQGGIPQTLSMLNGPLVAELTNPISSDLVAALADSPFLTNEQRIDAIFLSAITRYPTPVEWEQISQWMDSQGNDADVARFLSDLLWALVNSSDFSLCR